MSLGAKFPERFLLDHHLRMLLKCFIFHLHKIAICNYSNILLNAHDISEINTIIFVIFLVSLNKSFLRNGI